MDDDNPELKMVKSMLRAVLLSVKEGVPAETLYREYKEVVGDILPYKKFGFSRMEDFIMAMPDVVRVARRGQDYICHAVADESTAHIQKLVSKQRSKKPKKPARRPRGGGAGSKFLAMSHYSQPKPRPIPPRITRQPLMPRVVTPERRAMPTYMMQKTLTPVTIQIGNLDTGTRKIQLGSSRMLSKAVQEANTGRSQQPSRQQSSSSRFETPPRFRRQAEQSQQQQLSPVSSQATSYKRPATKKKEFAKIHDGDRYLSRLLAYLSERGQDVSFQITPMAGGYVSSIVINSHTYGSEDVYATASEAEQAVAKVAMSDLETRQTTASSLPEIDWDDTYSSVPSASAIPPEKLRRIKDRVKQILLSKRNGLWLSVLPFQYKKETNEEPPPDLIDLVKSWKDIAKIEFVPNTDREILYPVEDNSNKMLVIPAVPLITKCDEKVIVYMTFIHTPGYFFVQLEDSIVDTISELLQSHCKAQSSPDITTLEKGQFCAGIYSGDNSWTRAQIVNVRDDRRVQLFFVDYGNTEDISAERIRWLSPEIAEYPAQAITCSLFGIEPLEGETEWSQKSLSVFADLVKEEAMEAVPKHIYDNFVEVDLYLKSDPRESIADKLVKAGVVKSIRAEIETLEKMEPEPIHLPKEKLWDVYITYINASTNSVMVRLVGENYSDKLDAFQAELQTAFRNTSSEAPVVEGMTYVAYDDMLYHRVRLMAVEGKKVECYFLDHGDTDSLLPEQLQPLDPRVNTQLPYQAIEVSLCGLEDVATNTTALERLCELALTKTCVAEVIDREGIPSVVLFDTSSEEEDININEKILEAIEADGGGIDSSSSSCSTPQRILSPVPSDPQLSSTRTSEITPNITPSAENSLVSTDRHSTPLDKPVSENNNEIAVNKLQSMSLSESSIRTESPVKNLVRESETQIKTELQSPLISGIKVEPGQYLPPAVTQSPPRLDCERSRFTLDRTPEVPEIYEKKDTEDYAQSSSDKGSPSVNLSKPDILTNIPEIVKEEKTTKKKALNNEMVPLTSPGVGEYLEVHVNMIHDPSNFSCLPYEELNNLAHLYTTMKDYYDDKPPFTMTNADIKIGEMYAGWRDEIWYRVRVTQLVSQDLLSVYLVDQGEYSVMELSEIQPLYREFKTLPMMALHARLGGIEPVDGSWSEAAKYKFIELTKERDLIGLILDKDTDKMSLSLRLIDTSSETDLCIDEVLISMGYAKVASN